MFLRVLALIALAPIVAVPQTPGADLKQTEADGGIALWIDNFTVGHFADLIVTPR